MLSSLLPIVKDLISLFPNENKRLEATSKLNEIQAELAKAQMQVNAEEAKHTNLFVAGWRPFIGWVCGFGFAWSIVSPAFGWPSLDMNNLIAILGGMLGIGGLRTFEKIKGVNS